jgi:hypothetical protein
MESVNWRKVAQDRQGRRRATREALMLLRLWSHRRRRRERRRRRNRRSKR